MEERLARAHDVHRYRHDSVNPARMGLDARQVDITCCSGDIRNHHRKEDTMALPSVDVDRLLQETLRTMDIAGWAPPCNAYEDEQGYHIEVALPGMERQDISIVFEDGVLTV